MCQVLTETVKDTIAILVPKSVFPYCEIFYLQCQLLFSRYSTVYVVESIYILTIVYFKTTFINLQGNFKRIKLLQKLLATKHFLSLVIV